MLFGMRKNKELDSILLSLEMNASNNYKDNAQANYKEFCELLDQYKGTGKIKGKALQYYEGQKENWAKEMRNYTHKDQKALW